MQLVHIFDLPDKKSCYGCPMFDYVPCFDEYICVAKKRRQKTPARSNCPLVDLKSVLEYGLQTFFWREIEQEDEKAKEGMENET